MLWYSLVSIIIFCEWRSYVVLAKRDESDYQKTCQNIIYDRNETIVLNEVTGNAMTKIILCCSPDLINYNSNNNNNISGKARYRKRTPLIYWYFNNKIIANKPFKYDIEGNTLTVKKLNKENDEGIYNCSYSTRYSREENLYSTKVKVTEMLRSTKLIEPRSFDVKINKGIGFYWLEKMNDAIPLRPLLVNHTNPLTCSFYINGKFDETISNDYFKISWIYFKNVPNSDFEELDKKQILTKEIPCKNNDFNELRNERFLSFKCFETSYLIHHNEPPGLYKCLIKPTEKFVQKCKNKAEMFAFECRPLEFPFDVYFPDNDIFIMKKIIEKNIDDTSRTLVWNNLSLAGHVNLVGDNSLDLPVLLQFPQEHKVCLNNDLDDHDVSSSIVSWNFTCQISIQMISYINVTIFKIPSVSTLLQLEKEILIENNNKTLSLDDLIAQSIPVAATQFDYFTKKFPNGSNITYWQTPSSVSATKVFSSSMNKNDYGVYLCVANSLRPHRNYLGYAFSQVIPCKQENSLSQLVNHPLFLTLSIIGLVIFGILLTICLIISTCIMRKRSFFALKKRIVYMSKNDHYTSATNNDLQQHHFVTSPCDISSALAPASTSAAPASAAAAVDCSLKCLPPTEPAEFCIPLLSFGTTATPQQSTSLLTNSFNTTTTTTFRQVIYSPVFDSSQSQHARCSNDSGYVPSTARQSPDEFVDFDCESTTSYEIPMATAVTKQWEINRRCIELISILGEGEFGIVYRAQFRKINNNQCCDDQLDKFVAVKMLKANCQQQDVMALIEEVKIMKSLPPHPNVIQLLGTCSTGGPYLLIMEYANNGNLLATLRKMHQMHSFLPSEYDETREVMLNDVMEKLSPWLLEVAKQVGEGMHFLSSRNIVHRDLAARNILLDENGIAKIADFGLTRCVENYYVKRSNNRMPFRWMAPESFFQKVYTTRTDVWSFGIVLWELFSLGQIPYSSIEIENLPQKIRNGYRNPRPALASISLYHLMQTCWCERSDERPEFAQLVEQLTFLSKNKANFTSISSSSSLLSLTTSTNNSLISPSPIISTSFSDQLSSLIPSAPTLPSAGGNRQLYVSIDCS